MTTDLLLQSIGARIYFGVIAFAFGAVFGSFINCMAWRIVHHESVLHGRSHCAVCGHPLSAGDLVPIFSYLFLKGRCRYCGKKISPRYMAAEVIEGTGFLACFLKWGLSVDALRWMAMLVVLLGLSLVDLEIYEIPNRFTLSALVIWAVTMPFVHSWPGMTAGAAAGVSTGAAGGANTAVQSGASALAGAVNAADAGKMADAAQLSTLQAGAVLISLLHSALGAVVIAGGMLVISLIFDKVSGKESLGGGDIKLFFIAGLYLGTANGLLCVILSCVIGLIFAAAFRRNRIPFGPSISLALFLCALFGQSVVNWYMKLFL